MSFGQYRKRLLHALVLMSTVAGPTALGAAPEPGAPRNYDARVTYNAGLRQGFAPAQKTKEAELRRGVPELRVEVDETQGMVRSLTNPVGALSGPSTGDALTIGLDFVQRQRELLGLASEDLSNLEVTDRVYSKLSGVTHLYLRQVHKGVPVYNGQLQLNVDRDGRVLSVHNDLQPGLASALASVEPRVNADQAVASVAKHLGVTLKAGLQAQKAEPGARRRTRVEAPGLSSEPIDAQLSVLPVRQGEARLVWNFQVHAPDQQHDYDVTVDAQTGEVWTRVDWVAADDYRVYPRPVESPNHTTPLPPSDGRQLLLNPANTLASPFGWHDTNGVAGAEYTILRGNNVHAYEDSDNDGLPPTTQPDCGVSLHCDFPINLTGAPSTYIPAAVTNLFYWNNLLHDISYQYGFDEVGGNFQVNNYGHGALGNDDVRAEAQDGSGTNNANFSTPPDGSRPRMQMYVWTTSSANTGNDIKFVP